MNLLVQGTTATTSAPLLACTTLAFKGMALEIFLKSIRRRSEL